MRDTIFDSTITWHRPTEHRPPFNTPILAVLGSWVDRGYGFKPVYTVLTVTVLKEDADGDADQGKEMAAALKRGTTKWQDVQFRLLDHDDEELDWYSDSIMWWAMVPMFPDSRQPLHDAAADTMQRS